MNEAQTPDTWATVWCARSQTRTTLKRHYRTNNQKGTHESSVGFLMRVHMLQVCVHVKHVVVLVVPRIRVIISVIVNVLIYWLFTCMWISYNCSHCENGCCLYKLWKLVFLWTLHCYLSHMHVRTDDKQAMEHCAGKITSAGTWHCVQV